jgi:phage gp36-like protein
MAYCTVDDVKAVKAVKRLLAPDGAWSDDDISGLIDQIGGNVIDARIGKWYQVPVTPAPGVLSRVCRLKTAYEMLAQEYGENKGEYAYLNREAEWLLEGVAGRRIPLEYAETEAYPAPGVVNGDTRFFSLEDDDG